MDKENSGNLDELLERLKSTVENSDNAFTEETSPFSEDAHSEPINAELLKEKLREQFMSASPLEKEEEGGEYNIDNDLISEFYEQTEDSVEESFVEEDAVVEEAEETEKVEEAEEETDTEAVVSEEDVAEETHAFLVAEPEANEEEAEDTSDFVEAFEGEREDYLEAERAEIEEGEIVEIVIPWVGEIEEEVTSDEEDEEDEDFGGAPDEVYFDEQSDENAYICFADENPSDEEILGVDEDVAEEELVMEKSQYSTVPTNSLWAEDLSVLRQV